MQLPIEISPNPLVTAAIELRFQSDISLSKLFPLVYNKFLNKLPNLENNAVPPEFKKANSSLKYKTDYSMLNQDYKMSFSNCSLLFESLGDYKFWKNYYQFISECILDFFSLFPFEYFERIGVRYGSVLDKSESVTQVLISSPIMNLNEYKQKFEQYRSSILVERGTLYLQIYDNGKASKNSTNISGVYIDIDASNSNQINSLDECLSLIDNLHTEQKKLFFSLLKPEYLQTLHPKYS